MRRGLPLKYKAARLVEGDGTTASLHCIWMAGKPSRRSTASTFLNQPRGGEAFHQRHDAYFPPPRLHFRSAYNGFRVIVPAFNEDVGLNRDNQFEWRRFVEDHHGVDSSQRRQYAR